MNVVIENLFQIGEPTEHRGVVIAPLFPRNDPVVAYLTLDQALAGGLRIRETSESGSVPELAVENPLADRVLLYDGEELVGAKQNRILNVSVLVEANVDADDPRLLCGARALAARLARVRGRREHLARAAPSSQGGDAGGTAAGARSRAERGVGRAEREVASHVGRLSDGRERGSLPRARARPALARECLPCPARTVRSDLRDRATTCAWMPSPDRTPSHGSGRSSGPGISWTHSSGSTESQRLPRSSSVCSRRRHVPTRTRQPSAGSRRGSAPARRACHRLGTRARRRADPALCLPERRPWPASLRPDRPPEPPALSIDANSRDSTGHPTVQNSHLRHVGHLTL